LVWGFFFGKWKWCNICVFLLRIGSGVSFLAYESAIILSLFVHVVNNGSICTSYMSSLRGAKTKHNLMNE
jgi:hypothetical protein